MPPKGWKKTAAGFQPANSSFVPLKNRKEYGIDDLLLPRSLVLKIAKEALPPGAPVPKDGVTALMRAATMFVSYITATANDIAAFERRKTVSHTDILQALEKNHFGAFTNAVVELSAKRQALKDKSAEEPEIVEDEEPEEGELVENKNKRMKKDAGAKTAGTSRTSTAEPREASESAQEPSELAADTDVEANADATGVVAADATNDEMDVDGAQEA